MNHDEYLLGTLAQSGECVEARSSDQTPATALELPPGCVDEHGYVRYQPCHDLQLSLHRAAAAGERRPAFLALEHAPVFTAGRLTKDDERPWDGTEVIDVGRGGKVTWHGPGQLVVYLIGKLVGMIDTPKFVEAAERAIIDALAEMGLSSYVVPGRPGVWLAADARGPERKIAQIGFRISRGATFHGIAVNCSNDLRSFARIVPCGISDASVTSITAERGRTVTPADLIDLLLAKLSIAMAPFYDASANQPERTATA